MIYFTSDTHFGCEMLVENSRTEFGNLEEHDNHLIDRINSKVGRDDRLYILGDWCREKPGRYRPRLRCKNLFFILGNHDKEAKIRPCFGGNVWYAKAVKLACGNKVVCSHHPQAFWDGSHKGWYHAYGHLHYNRKYEAMMDLGLPGRRSMDVGVDAARILLGDYEPFSEEEFMAFLGGQKGHDIINPNDRWYGRGHEQAGKP